MGDLSILGFGPAVSLYLIISVLPFLWAMNNLLALKRPTSMKAIWGLICFFGGIMGVILFTLVVFIPQQQKRK